MNPAAGPPPAPVKAPPGAAWPHKQLYDNVIESLKALPVYFKSELDVSGFSATDVFTMNTALGAVIEEQCVETLNNLRLIWDPTKAYGLYSFVRQAQTFPDVRLVAAGQPPLLGIELKGWSLLAKEGEPSFRYTVTPAACAPADLLVVVPWALTNIISGPPIVFEPFICEATYAAEYRNYHWQHLRQAVGGNQGVTLAAGVNPYPVKAAQISDRANMDGGGNFGRFARTGLMDTFKSGLEGRPLRGIPAKYWRDFFKVFQDETTDAAVTAALTRLQTRARTEFGDSEAKVAEVVEAIIATLKTLSP